MDRFEILELVELAIGGEVIDNIYLNTRRFGIHVRYQESYRADPRVIEDLLVHAENGNLIPLKEVAQVKEVLGPIQVNREQNQRRWIVQGNVRDRDLGGVISDIKKSIDEKVELPAGYFIEYGGQFEKAAPHRRCSTATRCASRESLGRTRAMETRTWWRCYVLSFAIQPTVRNGRACG